MTSIKQRDVHNSLHNINGYNWIQFDPRKLSKICGEFSDKPHVLRVLPYALCLAPCDEYRKIDEYCG